MVSRAVEGMRHRHALPRRSPAEEQVSEGLGRTHSLRSPVFSIFCVFSVQWREG